MTTGGVLTIVDSVLVATVTVCCSESSPGRAAFLWHALQYSSETSCVVATVVLPSVAKTVAAAMCSVGSNSVVRTSRKEFWVSHFN